LLQQFEATFRGQPYKHRDPQIGNRIADFVFEDLYDVQQSAKYAERVEAQTRVLNPKARSPGIEARRGDGSFGRLVPSEPAIKQQGFRVARGHTATVEIGGEVKIVAKAMIKQIDRVINDLNNQARQFKEKGNRAITIALVGVNRAPVYTSFEGDRTFTTTGTAKYRHPIQEADEAINRLRARAQPAFDEFLILEFEATNATPFPFRWRSEARLKREYASALSRILEQYELRF
jgi:hypothetical protein